MAMNDLHDALLHELMDLLSAEKQITHALPKMKQKASADELKQAFEEHLGQTQQQVKRLEQALESMGRKPRSSKCEAMAGLIEEGEELMSEDAEPAVLDAMLIAAAQKVEHYEIASYGTACTWAKLLEQKDVLKLLKETLDEEEKTDQKLSKLAESKLNAAAVG